MTKYIDNENAIKNAIIRQLYFNENLSSSDLSRLLNKSIPSVTKRLNELVKEGKVILNGYADSGGGRRPKQYALPSNTQYLVAVAMDQLNTRINMVDLLNNAVAKTESIKLNLFDNSDAHKILADFINRFISRQKVKKDQIIGVGIGMPGFVNTREGVNYTHLSGGSKNLKTFLEEKINLPVWIDNDSSLVALSELRFGDANNKENAMVINIGWGIGLGMILNGEIFKGFNGYAGELSHIPLRDDGKLCTCGKRGCLETEASLLVISQKAIEEITEGKISSLPKDIKSPSEMGEAIMIAVGKGDQYAIELISDMGYKIGKAIAILIHIMDPETIILSGRGARVGNILMTSIKQALNKYCIPRLFENTRFQVSKLGHDAEILGAAAEVMENFGK